MIKPTLANGIMNQLPHPNSGMKASNIHSIEPMPHSSPIKPIASIPLVGRSFAARD